jgi:hypothetical protein
MTVILSITWVALLAAAYILAVHLLRKMDLY